jgi:hypothetical protein
VREHFGGYAKERNRPGAAPRQRQPPDKRSLPGELRFLSIESSLVLVREPEGNGCSERFVCTLKAPLLWMHHIATSARPIERQRTPHPESGPGRAQHREGRVMLQSA